MMKTVFSTRPVMRILLGGDYTADLTLIEMIDRRVGSPLREAPLWGPKGEGFVSTWLMKSLFV
jgi:hypothetical protein